jgi:hypothetical protein
VREARNTCVIRRPEVSRDLLSGLGREYGGLWPPDRPSPGRCCLLETATDLPFVTTVLAVTKPAAKAAESGSGLSVGWQVAIALGAAVVGGLLTLSGDLGVRRWSERSRFKSSMRAIESEVVLVENEAQTRIEPPVSGAISQSAPLPSSAWQTLVAGGLLTRIDTSDLGILVGFYRAVETANYLAAQAPLFIQTANLSDRDDVQRLFEEEARRLTSAPFVDVVAKAKTALPVARRYGCKP